MADTRHNLKIYYQGTDITEKVDLIECVCRDVSGRESDCLNLKVDHADRWFEWGTQKNDTIRITRNGYDTKTLYLNTIVPEDGAFRIFATGAKCVPFPAKWQSFEEKTLAAIMSTCAAEVGMGARQFGISGGITYPYLLRENESATVFLETLVNREGGVLKSLDGSFAAIGIPYAQGIGAMHTVQLDAKLFDVQYIDRRDQSWGSVEIKTPFGNGSARDAKSGGKSRIITDIAVEDDGQAYRWAKGILLTHNRKSEILNLEMDFNPGYTAMVRIDVESKTGANGQWIVDSVEQDLLNGRTKARLLRCISVG